MLLMYDFDLFKIICRRYEDICKFLDDGKNWDEVCSFLKSECGFWRPCWSAEDVRVYFRIVDKERDPA